MITIKICQTLSEAEVAKSELEGSGIKAYLPDEIPAQNMWADASQGIHVQVDESDADRAREVLGA
jgi:hypothetical protein